MLDLVTGRDILAHLATHSPVLRPRPDISHQITGSELTFDYFFHTNCSDKNKDFECVR